MKFANEINKSTKTFIALLVMLFTCNACHEQEGFDMEVYWQTQFLYILMREYNCSLPNAIDISSTRTCINGKLSEGLIYNNATSLAVTTTSVADGTQLECRGFGGTYYEYNRWYKSIVEPIPNGYAPIFNIHQEVNKDGVGNVISYQPFTSYASGDILICVPFTSRSLKTNYYQIVKIL